MRSSTASTELIARLVGEAARGAEPRGWGYLGRGGPTLGDFAGASVAYDRNALALMGMEHRW
jgi:hypothetical protein